MRWLKLLLFASVVWYSVTVPAHAESRCRDPKQREAAIGGDIIYGFVSQEDGKPLRNAQVKLYVLSTGKTAWVWRTDKDGQFTTPKLPRVAYRVEITGWGEAVVKVGSEQEKQLQQTINWTVDFSSDGCVGAGTSMD